jgi:AraC-like DNA-binding protein
MNGMKDDFERNMFQMVMIVLLHLSVKFFILVILKNDFLYREVATSFGLAYGPMLYIVYSIASKKHMPLRQQFFHLLPFAIFSGVYMCLMIGISVHSVSEHFCLAYTSWYKFLVIASLLGYPSVVLYQWKKISSAEQTAYWPVRIIAIMMLSCIVTASLLRVIHLLVHSFPEIDFRLLPYISYASIPVLFLQYKMKKNAQTNAIIKDILATHQQAVSISQEESLSIEDNSKKYLKSAINDEMMETYKKQLLAFMGTSKIYLEPELSLEMLAARINMPKHYLTQLLNEGINKNFYLFINEYRINEAKKRIHNSKEEISILSLAYECGFNSKSSFNNYFKKITGLTPTEYKEVKTPPQVSS